DYTMKTQLVLFLLLFSFVANAQLVQWRGPNRDGHFPETGLMSEWPENGPERILHVEGIGKGYSSPILIGDMIYTTGMIDTLDYLSATDMDGNIKWQVPYGRSWNQSFPDTRSTPVVEDDRIYVQSGTGEVSCINRETGETIWMVDVDDEFDGEYHLWGNSETPLIVDDKVICSPGGSETSVVALNKMTGETVWKTKSLGGPRAYVSATIYEYKDFRFILAVIGTHILAIQPETGEVAWSYKYYNPDLWDQNGLIWTNTPVFKDDEIFLTMGYDYFAVMLKMDSTGTSVSEKFIDRTFDNHHHGVILHDGHLYGSNWYNNKQGRWVCMVWDTGEIKYVDEWDTKGALVMADGMLYAYNERGNVALVKPDPDGFEVVSQFRITKGAGPHWAHPFISDGKMLIRHGDVLFVFDIKEK
ncbi:MAG: PQQ-binding-like beta-propeller repeat protein, partial [Mariniphaga sp.]